MDANNLMKESDQWQIQNFTQNVFLMINRSTEMKKNKNKHLNGIDENVFKTVIYCI